MSERDNSTAPIGYVTKEDLANLRFGVSCVDLFGSVVPKGAEMVPVYASPPPSSLSMGSDKKIRSITDSRDLARKLYEEAENENVVLRREIERLKSELSQARGE